MKKVISLLLSVLICINTLPVQVWAEDENTIEDVKEEIVEVVEDKQEEITNQTTEEQSTENVEEVLVVDEEQNQDQEEIIIEEEIKEETIIVEEELENETEEIEDVEEKPIVSGISPKPNLGEGENVFDLKIDEKVNASDVKKILEVSGNVGTSDSTAAKNDIRFYFKEIDSYLYNNGSLDLGVAGNYNVRVDKCTKTGIKYVSNATWNTSADFQEFSVKRYGLLTLGTDLSVTQKGSTPTTSDSKYKLYTNGGDVVVSYNGTVPRGNSYTISIGDNKSTGQELKISQDKITADMTASVEFTPITKMVNISISPAGVSGSGAAIQEPYKGVANQISLDKDYVLKVNHVVGYKYNISINGSNVEYSDSDEYTIATEGLTKDVDVSIEYYESKLDYTVTVNEQTYDGNSHNLLDESLISVVGEDGTTLTIGTDCLIEGTTEATNHSDTNYTFTITATNVNYDNKPKTIYWNIKKVKLTKPSLDNTSFDYTGGKHKINLKDFNSTYEKEGDSNVKEASEVGTYNVVVELIDKKNYAWISEEDNDIADVVLKWDINEIEISKPLIEDIYVGETNEKHSWDEVNKITGTYISIDSLNEDVLKASAETGIQMQRKLFLEGVSEGVAIVECKGLSKTIYIKVVVNRKTVDIPEVQSRTYNNTELEPFDSLDERLEYGETTGINNKATNAGNYFTAIKIKNTTNNKWNTKDNNIDDIRIIPWSIAPSTTISASLNEDEYIADGNYITPIITVTGVNGVTLVEDEDYEIVGDSTTTNKDAGNYHIYIAGKGNYTTGEKPIDLPWSINDGAIEIKASDITVTNKTYNTTAQTPDVSVVVNGKTLVKDTDYTVSVEAQTEHKTYGNYTLSVSAKGDKYTTSEPLVKEWNIDQLDISNVTITPSIESVTYDTTERTFNATLKIGEATVSSSNYEISGDIKKTNAGSYTATITPKQSLTGTAVSKNWSIIKADLPSYTVKGVTVEYDGQPHKLLEVTGLPEECKIHSSTTYSTEKANYSEGIVTEKEIKFVLNVVDDYDIWYYIDGGNNYKSSNINAYLNPVKSKITKGSIPDLTAISDLTYDGNSHVLVSGEVSGLSYLYLVGDGKSTPKLEDLLTDPPTGLNAGVYYVYYGANYNIKNLFEVPNKNYDQRLNLSKPVKVTIARASVGDKPNTTVSFDYDGDLKTNGYPKPDGVNVTGDASGTLAGTYTAVYAPDGNHCWSDGSYDEVTVTLTINKVASSYSQNAEVNDTTDYTGDPIDLLKTEADSSNGSVKYIVSSEDLSSALPTTDDSRWANTATATDAGTYYVYVCIKGDDNHSDTSASLVGTVTINKVNVSLTAPTLKTGLTYNEDSQDLINAGSVTGGDLYYLVNTTGSTPNKDDANWNKNVPQGSDAGTYYLWYKVIGDKNHSDIDVTKVGETNTVEIAKAKVNVPTKNEGLTYNYDSQIGVVVPKNAKVKSGSASQTDAGDYETIVELVSSNYEWNKESDKDDPITINWSISKATIDNIVLNTDSFEADGSKHLPEVIGVYAGGLKINSADYTLTGADFATNSQSEIGDSYEITAEANGKNSNIEGSKTVTWQITTAGDIASATVTLDSDSFEYDGETHLPTISSLVLGEKTLTKGEDFEIDNACIAQTDVNEYTLTINAIGSYTGTATKKWSITPTKNFTYEQDETDYEYDGDDHKPTITVKGVDGNPIDTYDITYNEEAWKNAGTYKAIITGSGNYTGSKTVTWTVSPKSIEVPIKNTGLVYNRNTLTGVSAGTGYTLTNNTGINANTYTATASLANSNYIWSDSTTTDKQIEWSIAPATIDTVTINNDSIAYDGNNNKPYITSVKAGGLTLSDSDYDVTDLVEQLHIGDYQFKVTGKGNYDGEKTVDWSIVNDYDLSKATVTYIGSTKTYNGQDQTVSSSDFKVVYDTITVDPSLYTVTANATGKNAGKYTATLTGATPYSKTNTCDWTIAPKNISSVTLESSSLEYNGEAQYPVVKDGDLTLTASVDFLANWPSDLKNVNNNLFADITGKGNYTGTATIRWAITKAKVTLPSAISGLKYTGEAQTGVTYDATKVPGIYSVTSGSVTGTNVNTYSATFKLTDFTNYKWDSVIVNDDSYTVLWSISKADANVSKITDLVYNGQEQELVTTTPAQNTKGATFEFATLNLGTAITDIFEGYSSSMPKKKDAKTYNVYWYLSSGSNNYNGANSKAAAALQIPVQVTIAPANLVSLTVGSEEYSYDGSAHVPSVTVKGVEADGTLALNTDYTLKYYDSNNQEISDINTIKNVGTYKVVATGKGNYTNTVEDTWKINKIDTPAPSANTDLTYSGEDQELVTVDDSLLGYKYYVATEELATIVDSASFGSSCEKKDAGTYYVYYMADGDDNHNAIEPSLTNKLVVTIQPAVVEIPTGDTLTYNGDVQKPFASIGEGLIEFVEDTGIVNSSKDAGEFTAKIRLKDLTNSIWSDLTTTDKEISWKIEPAEIDSLTIKNDGIYKYTGENITAEIEVKAGTLPLEPSDYDVTGNIHDDVGGPYTLTVTGKGNFKGTKSAEWKIIPDIKIDVENTDTTEERTVTYSITDDNKIKVSATPLKDNTYISKIKVIDNLKVENEINDGLDLTYDEHATATGYYSIAGVKKGDYTIDVTVESVEAVSKPSMSFVSMKNTPVTAADIIKVVLGEGYDTSDLTVKYDCSYKLNPASTKWVDLDYTPSNLEHAFGASAIDTNEEKIQITGANKYAKVNITTVLELVDDRLKHIKTDINPKGSGSFDELKIDKNDDLVFRVYANDQYFIDSFELDGSKLDSKYTVTYEYKPVKILDWIEQKNTRMASFTYNLPTPVDHTIKANLVLGFEEKLEADRTLNYISGVSVFTTAELKQAILDAVAKTNIKDADISEFNVQYSAASIGGRDLWVPINADNTTLSGLIDAYNILIGRNIENSDLHNFGEAEVEKIKIDYSGSNNKYKGLSLSTTLKIVDDRLTTRFVVTDTVQIHASDLDKETLDYYDLVDVIIKNVPLLDKNDADVYKAYADKSEDIKKDISITYTDKDGNTKPVNSILNDLPYEEEVTLHVAYKGIYQQVTDGLKYKGCEADVKVKYTRYVTNMHFDDSSILITYDPDGANLANVIKGDNFITMYNMDKEIAEPITFDMDKDISWNPTVLDASLIKARSVKVDYAGNKYYQPCSNTLEVRVLPATSNLDIDVESKTFDGLPIDIKISSTPANIVKTYIIAGVEGDAEGFVSMNLDTTNTLIALDLSSSLPKDKIDEYLEKLNKYDHLDMIPDSFNEWLYEILNKYGSNIENTASIIVEAFDKAGIKLGFDAKLLVPLISYIEFIDGDTTYTPYFNYGKLLVDIGKDIFSSENKGKSLEVLQKALETYEVIFGEVSDDNENILSAFMDVASTVLNSINNIDRITFTVNETPRNAGGYLIAGITLNRNYVPDIETKMFYIRPVELEPYWDQEIVDGKISILDVKDFNFGADDKFFKEYTDSVVAAGGLKDETTYTTLYVGDRYNGVPYAGSTPCLDAGIYTETVIFAGNYEATMSRTYKIDRVDTDINLGELTFTYGDTNIESSVLEASVVHADNKENLNSIIKFVGNLELEEIVNADSVDDALKIIGNLVNPLVSDEVPSEAGVYPMIAYYFGDDTYKPTVSVGLLTINKALINIGWKNDWTGFDDANASISDSGYMLTYTYINHDDKIDNKYYITYPVNNENTDLFDRDHEAGRLDLTVRNILNEEPVCIVGEHTLEFVLTGWAADNYRIDNGIADTTYLNSLAYTILRKDISIGWKSIEDIKALDNHSDFDGKLSNNNYTLTYTYRGQDDCGVEKYYYIDTDAFIYDIDGVTINVYGQSKDAGLHDLVFLATGKYASNYDIENHITGVTDNTLGYVINKAELKVRWNKNWADEHNGSIGQLGYMLTYTYIDHNDKMLEGSQYTITYPENGSFESDKNGKYVDLDVKNILHQEPVCTVGEHTLEFILSGKAADNFKIDNGIADTTYINTLAYTILRKKISIAWKLPEDIKKLDDDYSDFDGTLTLNGYNLMYTYRGQDDNVDDYYNIDTDAFKEDTDGVSIIVTGQNPNAGGHQLLFTAVGKYAYNYDIDNGFNSPEIVDNTLAYEIIPVKLVVDWKDDTTDEVVDNVYKYIYNKQINYLDDKYEIVNSDKLLDDIGTVILYGKQTEAGKYSVRIVLTGTYKNNYYLTSDGISFLGITDLDYEILQKPVTIAWKDEAGIVEEDKLTYIYNGEINYLSNHSDIYMFETSDFLDGDIALVDMISGYEVNVGKYEATFGLFGKDAHNYVLVTEKLPYEIIPKDITVEWTKVVFDVASNEIKMPHYEFIGLVKNDPKPFIIFEYYDLDGNKISRPSSVGTYLAKIAGLNDDNYVTEGETLYVICDFDSLIENPDYDIVAASINDEALSRESLVKAKLTECPTYEEAISILSSLDDDTLLNGFTNDEINRIMTFLLEATHLEQEELDEIKPLVTAKYGKGVYNKSFFLNIDLYTMVSGIISKEHVHEPGYEVPVTIKVSKDSEVAKLIKGRNKLYYVIRVHNGEVDRIPAKCTRDDNGDYLLSFKSDRFSVYGFYCVDKPQPDSYVVPKTGIR